MLWVWMACMALCWLAAAILHDAAWTAFWGVLAITAHLQRIEDPD